jgi:hypothetical protein
MTSGDGTDDKATDRPSPESNESANKPEASNEPPAAKALPLAPKPLPLAPKPVVAGSKPLPPAPKPVVGGANALPLAPTPAGASAKPLPLAPRPAAAGGAKPLPAAPKPVAAGAKPLPAAPRPVGAAAKPLPSAPKPMTEASKALPTAPKPLPSAPRPLPTAPKPAAATPGSAAASKAPVAAAKSAAPPPVPHQPTPSAPISMANAPGDTPQEIDSERQFEGELPEDFDSVLAKVEKTPASGLLVLLGRALHRLTAGRAGQATHSERRVAFDGFRSTLHDEKTERDRRYGTVYEVSDEANAYLVRFEMPRRLPNSALKAMWNLPDEMPDYAYSLTLADGVLAIRASVRGEAYRRLSYVSASFPSEFLTRIAFDKPVGRFKHRLRDKILEIVVFKGPQERFGRAA